MNNIDEINIKRINGSNHHIVRIHILAGTYDEARFLAKDNELPDWRYVDRVDYLRGLRKPVVWLYGTYRRRHDYEEIMSYLNIIEAYVSLALDKHGR